MKKLWLTLTSTLALFCSCDQITLSDTANPHLVDVTVGFSDFDISTEPLSKAATGNADSAKVSRIVLAVFDGSNNLITDTTLSKDADPANFAKKITLHIPAGSYKFVAVAHTVANSSDAAVTINSVSEVSFGTLSKLGYTYTKVQDVTIDGISAKDVTIDFGTRRNTIFYICMTDQAPTDMQRIELIVNPSANDYTDLKVDPSTGFATTVWRYKNIIVKDGNILTTFKDTSLGIPFLLTSASESVNITINAIGTDDSVLHTRTLSNVTLKQGHQTTARGSFFRSDSTSFIFDTVLPADTIPL